MTPRASPIKETTGGKPLEPAQQELLVMASEEVGFSHPVDVGQFFRTRAECDAR